MDAAAQGGGGAGSRRWEGSRWCMPHAWGACCLAPSPSAILPCLCARLDRSLAALQSEWGRIQWAPACSRGMTLCWSAPSAYLPLPFTSVPPLDLALLQSEWGGGGGGRVDIQGIVASFSSSSLPSSSPPPAGSLPLPALQCLTWPPCSRSGGGSSGRQLPLLRSTAVHPWLSSRACTQRPKSEWGIVAE